MALTQAEQTQFWQVLKDSPLVQKWPNFRTHLLPSLELQTYAPGDFVFRREILQLTCSLSPPVGS